jgi:hypothetical protein
VFLWSGSCSSSSCDLCARDFRLIYDGVHDFGRLEALALTCRFGVVVEKAFLHLLRVSRLHIDTLYFVRVDLIRSIMHSVSSNSFVLRNAEERSGSDWLHNLAKEDIWRQGHLIDIDNVIVSN